MVEIYGLRAASMGSNPKSMVVAGRAADLNLLLSSLLTRGENSMTRVG